MADRLRKLDTLFAERVLGFGLGSDLGGNMRWYNAAQEPIELPPYTRSLDAAWEGAERLGVPGVCKGWEGEGYSASISRVGDYDADEIGFDTAHHPAEALVLACLRAVGVTDDELPT